MTTAREVAGGGDATPQPWTEEQLQRFRDMNSYVEECEEEVRVLRARCQELESMVDALARKATRLEDDREYNAQLAEQYRAQVEKLERVIERTEGAMPKQVSLKRVVEQAAADVKRWPAWMRRTAGHRGGADAHGPGARRRGGGGRMRYRKKPVVVEAVQWTGRNADEVLGFVLGHASVREGSYRRLSPSERELVIETLEGDMRAAPGDWIIKGIAGEIYPCKPDIFAATYEPVE